MSPSLKAQTSEAHESPAVVGATQGSGQITISNSDTINVHPFYFQLGGPDAPKIECAKMETSAPDKPWDVTKVSDCRIVGELPVDLMMNGVLTMYRSKSQQYDQCEEQFRTHLKDDVKMLEKFQKTLQPPKHDPLKKG